MKWLEFVKRADVEHIMANGGRDEMSEPGLSDWRPIDPVRDCVF